MINRLSEYCPFCHTKLKAKGSKNSHLCPECLKDVTQKKQLLEDIPIPKEIGCYRIEKWIGRGGMGEVYLGYDPVCKRDVAIKRIRTDIEQKPLYCTRFLREAYLTAQLTHPSIVPIFSIHEEKEQIYYVMPFVEGKTLKLLLQEAFIAQKAGIERTDSKIPYFIRIFINVCQAVAYAHSKGVLHRDLKPENVMIGQYGHVLILDWGLIKRMDEEQVGQTSSESAEDEDPTVTMKRKVIGTLAYLAPERVMGGKANVSSEIYALGVILYQILTLNLPFHRPSVTWFIKHHETEKLVSPAEVAPYRDVPDELDYIVSKCLEKKSSKRFGSVDELILGLENYLEGRTSWLMTKELNITNKHDWEFQENILIPEYLAISSKTVETNWVTVMVSKKSFSGNTKIVSRFKLEKASKGIGFLFAVPESAHREEPTDGYCLWLTADKLQPSKLVSSAVDVMELPEILLPKEEWIDLRLEKIDHTIRLFINNHPVLTYISHIPLTGTHVGLLYRDANFSMGYYRAYIGSPNITVSCLSVPDAFLARRQYKAALSEYRRIGYSFIGRAESREALFRAGITLLEQGKNERRPELFDSALKEFEMLEETAAAPLEYLGKALVYQTIQDGEEEAKCLELAICKYDHHPLINLIHQQLFFRLHESSRKDRLTAYRFALIALYHLFKKTQTEEHKKLIDRLKKEWEHLPFLTKLDLNEECYELVIPLAFWLDKRSLLESIIESLADQKHSKAKDNASFALLFLTQDSELEKKLRSRTKNFDQITRVVIYHLECSWEKGDYISMEKIARSHQMHYYLAVSLLGQNRVAEAHDIILMHFKEGQSEITCWHILNGFCIAKEQGESAAKSYFKSLLLPPHPPTFALIASYLSKSAEKRKLWAKQSFAWEQKALIKQLQLYYAFTGKKNVFPFTQT
ncbi:MAG: protein kinase [Parachlamydiales bacterium]|nr:protein kinase [Parachlamydiales bacterium]